APAAEAPAPAESAAPAEAAPAEAEAPAEVTPPSSPYLVQLVGATSGGTYFLVMNGFAQMLNDKLPEWFKASAQSTSGGLEILRLLESGDSDFGMGQAGVARTAIDGTYGDGNQPKFVNIASVTYMYPNVMQIAVANGSGIEDFTDFAGKSFCAGASGSATETNTQDMYAACGIEYSDKMQYTSESQSVELMKNGQADGANLIAAIGAASVTELYSTGKYHLLSFTDEQLDAICAKNPAYYKFVIPAGTYANQDEDINTFAVANYFFARADMDEDAVYTLTKTLYENIDEVRSIHNVLANNFALENCTDGMTVPLHPGAERYYKEVGALK
ncbi:MAG: TAXI family TRAP transporter solute-binding subunit, partial [Lachnospiraceae bacterium]|nr:TAXI family TRAP transporter solute-binding subunit [Lachnospiraceae bacterium]